MTAVDKCERCMRNGDCSIRQLIEKTLPFTQAALAEKGMDDWTRTHAIGRTLRGNGGSESPGYVEDAVSRGAMTRDDVQALIERVVRTREVSCADMCAACRHYVGP